MARTSVIVPVYNNDRYIAGAIESVLSQEHVDLEIIVVDDGSDDRTGAVVKAYENTGRVRYCRQERRGVAAARNRGLREARGDYVAFLDSDDLWLAGNLKVKTGILDGEGAIGGVVSNFSIIDSDGRVTDENGLEVMYPVLGGRGRGASRFFPEKGVAPGQDGVAYRYGNIFDIMFQGNIMLNSTIVFRRAAMESVGPFDEKFKTQEDYEFWLRFTKEHMIAYVDDVYVHYRRHGGQLTDYSNIEDIITNVIAIIEGYEKEMTHRGGKRIFRKRLSQCTNNLTKVYVKKGKWAEAMRLSGANITRNPFYLDNYKTLLTNCLYGMTRGRPSEKDGKK